jgi:V/A-type H+-transporting ATPase subunit F
MHKIGVIGDKNSILAFKAFGFDTYEADESSPDNSRRLLERMAKGDYGMIFITEQIAAAIMETIDRYVPEITPAIVLIPGNLGSLGVGMAKIRSNVEKAVGINILD